MSGNLEICLKRTWFSPGDTMQGVYIDDLLILGIVDSKDVSNLNIGRDMDLLAKARVAYAESKLPWAESKA